MIGIAGHPADKQAYESQGYLVFNPDFSPALIASVHADVRGLLDAQLSKWKPYRETDTVLHPQVIHGSGSNVSGKERMAMTMSYQAPKPGYDARWAGAGMRFIRDGKKTWEPLPVSG